MNCVKGDRVKLVTTSNAPIQMAKEDVYIYKREDNVYYYVQKENSIDYLALKSHWKLEKIMEEYKIEVPEIPADVKKIKDKFNRIWLRNDCIWARENYLSETYDTKELLYLVGPVEPVRTQYSVISSVAREQRSTLTFPNFEAALKHFKNLYVDAIEKDPSQINYVKDKFLDYRIGDTIYSSRLIQEEI